MIALGSLANKFGNFRKFLGSNSQKSTIFFDISLKQLKQGLVEFNKVHQKWYKTFKTKLSLPIILYKIFFLPNELDIIG